MGQTRPGEGGKSRRRHTRVHIVNCFYLLIRNANIYSPFIPVRNVLDFLMFLKIRSLLSKGLKMDLTAQLLTALKTLAVVAGL